MYCEETEKRNPHSVSLKLGETVTLYDKIKNTFKHTFIYSIGSLVNSAFGIFLVPLYTRKLRANEYAILALLTLTFTLLSGVLKFGLHQAFFHNYYATKEPTQRHRIVGTALLFLLLSTSVFTVLLYNIAPQLSALIFKGDTTKDGLLRIIFLITFFEVLKSLPDSMLRAEFRSVRYSLLNIFSFVLEVGLIIYFVLFVEASVKSVLMGKLISGIIEAVLFYFTVRRDLSLQFSFVELKELLHFGVPLIFTALATNLFFMSDRFFLEHFSGEREVGVYALANNIVGAVTMLATMPFAQVWTVMRFKVMHEDGAEEYYSRVLTYIVFLSMFLSLGAAALGGDLVLLYAHRSYNLLPTLLPLLAIAVVFDSASRVLNVGITLRKRTIYGSLLTVVALAFNIALNFILIPRYGSLGATISTLISYLFFAGLRYGVSNYFFKVKYEWGRVVAAFAVGIVITVLFYAIDYKRGDAPHTLTLVLSMSLKVLLALSFPLVLFALKFYDPRELHRLTEARQKVFAMIKNRKRSEVFPLLLLCLSSMVLAGYLLSAPLISFG